MAKEKSNASFNVEKIRADFPILKRHFGKNTVAYLDNAASTQKPQVVIDALTDFYSNHYSNVHRSVSTLAMEATDAFEKSREKVAKFVNAKPEQIIFTKNTTESINLVAHSYGLEKIQKSDEILTTVMEHHSNFLPWQSSYSEFLFIDKLWPDFEKNDFLLCLKDYADRERRFGK